VTELLNTLYVQTPGTSLHLDGGTIRVVHPDRPGRKVLPLARIDHLVLFSLMMLTLLLAFFPPETLQRLLAWLGRGKDTLWLGYDSRLPAQLQAARLVRPGTPGAG